jgi:hypothetical protein
VKAREKKVSNKLTYQEKKELEALESRNSLEWNRKSMIWRNA